ncbi:MAG: histidine kinase [Firmicutes bacterium HGW-Firmicutes-3]|jgi:two-component system sensor histidine kinase DegS|nr:MAG: histidine kinase [Firmicutes bacterium HGW-Firmicutes-3]
MYKKQFDQLDEIIDKTIDSIKDSVKEIKDISDYARQEYLELEEEFLRLKIEATNLIDRVDSLERKYKLSKSKLLMVNKNFNDYGQEEMQQIYEATDKLRVDLAVEKEREMNLIKRRNELELHLKYVRKISEKADKLSYNFDIAYSVLSGDLKKITEKIDDIQNKEIWGLKVIEAQEIERQRIARDMHDGPAQSLSNLIIKTELCIRLLDIDIDRTKLELQTLKMYIRGTIDETRRMIYNLRPMSIDDLGLIPTLERLIEKMSDDLGFAIELNVVECDDYPSEEIDPVVNLTLYRITQEALNNVLKYSKATSVCVDLTYEDSGIELEITDNGVGFEVGDMKLRLEDNKGFGMSMMRERANLLSSNFKIVSKIGKGTSIHIRVPLVSKEERHE